MALQNLPEHLDRLRGSAADAYRENISSDPLRHTAFGTAAGGALGYAGSKALAGVLARLLGAGKTPEEKEEISRALERSGRLKALGALAGGALGAYLTGSQHADTESLSTLRSSMTDPNYWKKNPDRFASMYAKAVRDLHGNYRSRARDQLFR
jgi:hypothetical protein